jgi:hypothetical protein
MAKFGNFAGGRGMGIEIDNLTAGHDSGYLDAIRDVVTDDLRKEFPDIGADPVMNKEYQNVLVWNVTRGSFTGEMIQRLMKNIPGSDYDMMDGQAIIKVKINHPAYKGTVVRRRRKARMRQTALLLVLFLVLLYFVFLWANKFFF